MKKLYLFTNHYPFEKGEEFLKDELYILTQYFSEIICVSSAKDFSKVRDIPDNVTVEVVNRNYAFIRSILWALFDMISRETLDNILLLKSLKNKVTFNDFKRIFIYYSVYRRVEKWAKTKGIKDSDDAVLYSYWLGPGAYALAQLKKNGYQCLTVARGHGSDVLLDKHMRTTLAMELDRIYFSSYKTMEIFKSDVISTNIKKLNAELYVSRLGVLRKLDNSVSSNLVDYFHIVTCSNIIPLKRIDLIIEALSMLDKSKIIWTHIGTGELEEYMRDLAEVKFNNLNVKVVWKGYLDNNTIHSFYKNNYIDLFMNLSDSEGVPVSIMEALSYGIPIIARNVGGISEIVIDGKNGILLPEISDKKQIAQAINVMLNMPIDERQLLREGALRIWSEFYDARKNYNSFATSLVSETYAQEG
jgi:colanic acid/amylovoran biosynthesis glycosyltransferase